MTDNRTLPNCIFCGEPFEDAPKLNTKIECECGETYKISMYTSPNVSGE